MRLDNYMVFNKLHTMIFSVKNNISKHTARKVLYTTVILTFTLLVNCFCANGQAVKHISNFDSEVKLNSASTKLMTQRIKESAIQNQDYAPVPRLAHFDLAFAAGINEYKELNTFVIIYIASMNQDQNENPIKRVYFKTKNDEAELIMLASMPVAVTDSTIKNVFGENRVDYYYFIPYFYTQLSGELLIDWNSNSKGFELCEFPRFIKLSYLANESIYPDNKKILNPETLASFVKREFQITMNPK